jgi:hypothetical protein
MMGLPSLHTLDPSAISAAIIAPVLVPNMMSKRL